MNCGKMTNFACREEVAITCAATLSLSINNAIRTVVDDCDWSPSYIVCCFFSQVYSAAGDGTDERSCRLYAYSGTSMSCPIVAGAAAMVSSRIKPWLSSTLSWRHC